MEEYPSISNKNVKVVKGGSAISNSSGDSKPIMNRAKDNRKDNMEIVTEEDYTKPKISLVNKDTAKEAYTSKVEDSKKLTNVRTKRPVAAVNVID